MLPIIYFITAGFITYIVMPQFIKSFALKLIASEQQAHPSPLITSLPLRCDLFQSCFSLTKIFVFVFKIFFSRHTLTIGGAHLLSHADSTQYMLLV